MNPESPVNHIPKPDAPVAPDAVKSTVAASATPPVTAAPKPAPAAPKPAPAPVAPPPPPPPVPAALASVALPFVGVDFSSRGFHADAKVEPAQVVTSAEQMDKAGFALDTITGVDWLAENQMELVYDYFHPVTGLRVALRTRIPREKPEIATISLVYPGANWHERETHDFFGIIFVGHNNLTPFLLPEDATFHPLRKDFPGCPPEEQGTVPGGRNSP